MSYISSAYREMIHFINYVTKVSIRLLFLALPLELCYCVFGRFYLEREKLNEQEKMKKKTSTD